MRIHSLELNAYGPFPGNLALNFDELNEEGIFLLNGPTGSGKSSILDAICYGLYGSTSSGRTDLKSRFAEPEVEPWVKLECSVAGKRYRIFRSPEYLRPKKRGEGLTREQAKVTVETFDLQTGTWEADPAATRHRDAGAYMYSVIGLTAQQFNQVMLLPQGRFQQFLVAKSAEREELLKKLFATRDYEGIQVALDERAKAAEQKAGAALAQIDELTARAARAGSAAQLEDARALLGLENPDEQAEPQTETQPQAETATPENALNRAHKTLAEITELQEATGALIQELDTELPRLRTKLTDLSELSRNWQQYRQLVAQQAELESQLEQIGAAEATLALHSRASGALPLISAATRAQEALTRASDRLEAAGREVHRAVGLANQGLTPEAAEYGALTSAQDLTDYARGTELAEELTALASELTDLARTETQLAGLTATQQTAEQVTSAVRQKVEEAAAAQDQHRDLTQQLIAEHGELEDAGAQLTAAQMEQERALSAVAAAQKLLAARARTETAEQKAAVTEEKRREAATSAETLQQQRFESATATLAASLVAGEPCAVCGSTTHPAPATASGEMPTITPEQITAARQVRDGAEEAARTALSELSAARATLTELTASGALSPQEAEAQEQRARQGVQHAQQAVTRRTELTRLLAEAETRAQKLAASHRDSERELTQHLAQLDQRAQEIKNYEATLAPHRQSTGFAHRAKNLTSLAQALSRAAAALAESQRLTEPVSTAQAELRAGLAESRFANAQEVHTALLSEDTHRSLSARVTEHREQELTLRGKLSTDAMSDIADRTQGGQEPPPSQDLENLNRDITERQNQRDNYLSTGTRLAGASAELASTIKELTGTLTRTKELVERAHLARELAATALAAKGSDNALRMTLTTYVLAAQLEEVALAASEHLERMTHGRYRLQHTDDAEGRGSRSGLGLLVHDAWHSATRHPSTLSGGETFMASLSLALGLADMVQQTNGGIEIDTLFVDEGFGSLDDETLEEVMSTIDTLREGGRVIGLISHVAEMKNRITKHVQLETSPTGSSLVTQTGVA